MERQKTMKMKNKMKAGWYLNGGGGWYWDGKNFTDHLTSDAVQWSCVCRDCDDSRREKMQEDFADAKGQLGNVFVSVDGPYDFDDICDGNRIIV